MVKLRLKSRLFPVTVQCVDDKRFPQKHWSRSAELAHLVEEEAVRLQKVMMSVLT